MNVFDHRIIYMHTHHKEPVPRLLFNKWFVDDEDEVHECDHEYTPTESSWKRMNALLPKTCKTIHQTCTNHLWIAFWFDSAI